MGRLVTIRRVFMGEESFVVRVRVSEKKKQTKQNASSY